MLLIFHEPAVMSNDEDDGVTRCGQDDAIVQWVLSLSASPTFHCTTRGVVTSGQLPLDPQFQ